MKSLARFAKDKLKGSNDSEGVLDTCTLALKTTPSKDARKVAEFSLLSQYMLKRNEQGVWQKRFVCIVPHLFLYYFDSDQSDSPRGVIDLEYYTKCTADGENVLTLSPTEGILLRSFYFQIESPTVLSDWMTSIQRDRYMTGTYIQIGFHSNLNYLPHFFSLSLHSLFDSNLCIDLS